MNEDREIGYCANCDLKTEQTYLKSGSYKGFDYQIWGCLLCEDIVVREMPESKLVTMHLKLGDKPPFKPEPCQPKFIDARNQFEFGRI